MDDPTTTFDVGTLIGRGQAFSLVASHSSAALAECLAKIRQDGMYKALNLTWEEFCTLHAGVSRAHADQIIRQLKEFGHAYFRLSEIIRISPQSYRMIEGAVKGEMIEVNGESIPINPEHAARIRQALSALRADLRKAQTAQARSSLGITELKTRLDTCFDQMSSLSVRSLDDGERAALQGLIRYSFNRLKRVARKSLREE